jgi:NAD(P)-dependent dehydrogenase (short-subunit alcohol dehydrogenase family)
MLPKHEEGRMQEFEGRVAVVTGAASGIGLATATRFAQEGMRVVLADIERAPLAEAVSKLEGLGHEVRGIQTDVTQWSAVQSLADQTLEAFGQVNVVHNNAGVVRAGRLEELSLADWEWVLGVDLWSVIYGVKAFLPLIREAGEGHIVNTASSAGLQASPEIGPYNVAKFGVVALTETLHLELSSEDSPIGASVLCPGAIATRIGESERNRPDPATETETNQRFHEMAGKVVARGHSPESVAELVVSAIRGQEFWILTHPEWIDVLRRRVEGMENGRRLVAGFGG